MFTKEDKNTDHFQTIQDIIMIDTLINHSINKHRIGEIMPRRKGNVRLGVVLTASALMKSPHNKLNQSLSIVIYTCRKKLNGC